MTSAALLLGALGVVLIWAAVKDEDPRRLIADVFSGRRSGLRNSPGPAPKTGIRKP